MYGYKKNTAGQNVGFYLATCGCKPVTEGSVTVYRSIDGGSQTAATGTVTSLGGGHYNFAMSQADTNGDEISFLFTASSAAQVEKTIVTGVGSEGCLTSINYNRPERMFPFCIPATALRIGVGNATTEHSGTSNFWTALAQTGTVDTTTFTATVTKQILALTGKGEVLAVIGPVCADGDTTQFTIEIDGVTWVSPTFSMGTSTRAGLVSVPDPMNTSVTIGVFSDGFMHSDPLTFDGSHALFSTSPNLVPTFAMPQALSSPRLEFQQSCTISVTLSTNTSSGTYTNSGVVYRKFATWT